MPKPGKHDCEAEYTRSESNRDVVNTSTETADVLSARLRQMLPSQMSVFRKYRRFICNWLVSCRHRRNRWTVLSRSNVGCTACLCTVCRLTAGNCGLYNRRFHLFSAVFCNFPTFAVEARMSQATGQLATVMQESRVFPPTTEFSSQAEIGSLSEYEALWNEANGDIEAFWGKYAKELHWFEPFQDVGVERTVCQMVRRRKNQRLLQLPGRPSYIPREEQSRHHLGRRARRHAHAHLSATASRSLQVCQRAEKARASRQGDVVSIYMPMTPELAIAMLACARIGAVHSVIFGGFSSEAIADRNNDAKAKVGHHRRFGWRRGQELPLKKNVDRSLAKSPTVENCVVLQAYRQPSSHAGRPRSLVARTNGRGLGRLPRRTAR